MSADHNRAPLKLLLLPYAGGGRHIYRSWPSHLPRHIQPIALDLPGHGGRSHAAALHEWPKLIDHLVREVRPLLDEPFGIFGHSMGALVGLELAHALRASLGVEPIWFGASGCIAPSRREPEPGWLDRPEAEVIEKLRRLGGTPPEVLENRELLDLVLPMLRADFHLCGCYAAPSRRPLSSPMLVLGGSFDEVSQPLQNLEAWSRETSGSVRLEMLEGGHFFIDTHRDAVIRLVARALAEVMHDTMAGCG